MLSIILTANNEKHLLSCIKNLAGAVGKPAEIIVVLDGDTEAVNVPRQMPVKFIENEERLGIGKSRNIGARAAQGDVLCFCDAHVWVRTGTLDLLAGDAKEKSPAVIVPAFGNFKEDFPNKIRYNYGGGLVFKRSKWWFYLCVERYDRRRFARRRGCHAVGMTMTRETFEKLGGWLDMPGYWSSNDVAMSLKALMTDTPILVEPRVKIAHMVRSVRAHQTPGYHQVLNRYYTAGVLFSRETYGKFWLPNFMRVWPLERYGTTPERIQEINRALDPKKMRKARDEFRRNIVWPDDKILGILVGKAAKVAL